MRFARQSLNAIRRYRSNNVYFPQHAKINLSSFNFSTSTETYTPGIGKGKTSTGIVGLAVDHDAVPKIIEKSQALLDKLAASDIPETFLYHEETTKLCNYFIKTCKAYPDDPEKIEDEIRLGQVEEIVQGLDDEMIVMDMFIESRLWEHINEDVPIEWDPEIDFQNDPVEEK